MGVVHKKSTIITNRDASPQVLNDAHLVRGMLLEAVGTLEVAATDSSLSTLRFVSVPSNTRISQILLSCDDSGTAGIIDIGIYKTTADGGAVVDQDLFASAQALTTALNNSDVTHESTEFNVAEIEKQLWELAGLTADPGIDYDITATVTTAAEDATTVSLKVRYVL